MRGSCAGGEGSVDRGGGKQCVVRAAGGRAAGRRCRRVARAGRQLHQGLPVQQGRLAAAQGYRYDVFSFQREADDGVFVRGLTSG